MADLMISLAGPCISCAVRVFSKVIGYFTGRGDLLRFTVLQLKISMTFQPQSRTCCIKPCVKNVNIMHLRGQMKNNPQKKIFFFKSKAELWFVSLAKLV